mmetsp:Transcript_6941/g.28433  ORF Transcript_6941/g.28433 Transcript_6941/m.28433 type:complete len:271 (-) Transcript_6941:632-1444(-)
MQVRFRGRLRALGQLRQDHVRVARGRAWRRRGRPRSRHAGDRVRLQRRRRVCRRQRHVQLLRLGRRRGRGLRRGSAGRRTRGQRARRPHDWRQLRWRWQIRVRGRHRLRGHSGHLQVAPGQYGECRVRIGRRHHRRRARAVLRRDGELRRDHRPRRRRQLGFQRGKRAARCARGDHVGQRGRISEQGALRRQRRAHRARPELPAVRWHPLQAQRQSDQRGDGVPGALRHLRADPLHRAQAGPASGRRFAAGWQAIHNAASLLFQGPAGQQ